MEKLERRFMVLQNRLVSELEANNKSVQEVINSLSQLPYRKRLEHEADLSYILSELQQKKTIQELFNQLNLFSSFVDYRLPEYIMEQFGSTRLQNDMSTYIRDVKAFMRHTQVGDLMEAKWPGRQLLSESPGFQMLWVKVKRKAKSYTLEKLNDLRIQLCADLKVSQLLSSIVSLLPSSSFFAVFAIPVTFATAKADRRVEAKNHEKYEAEGIEMIILDDMLLYLRPMEPLRKVRDMYYCQPVDSIFYACVKNLAITHPSCLLITILLFIDFQVLLQVRFAFLRHNYSLIN